jgi:hypothetical protein
MQRMSVLHFAVTAVCTALLAAAGFGLGAWADAFAPCRVPYRLSDELYGSLACQLYYTLGLFSAVLAFAACGLTVVAGILFVVRRRTRG